MMTIETRSNSMSAPASDRELPTPPMCFGFAAKVMGQEGLKSNDTRRWQNEPHLRVSSDIAPYVMHPDMPQFHNQIQEAAGELRANCARTAHVGAGGKAGRPAPLYVPVAVYRAE